MNSKSIRPTSTANTIDLISINAWMFGGGEQHGVFWRGWSGWRRPVDSNHCLTSAAGQKLNGKVGQVLNANPNEDGRLQIKIDGDASRGKLIKETNIIDVPRHELVKTCRLSARGEDSNCLHKVLLFPKDHSMFTNCNPKGDYPVMTLWDCRLP